MSQFEPILAKKTPEFFDKIKVGEFTLNRKFQTVPWTLSGMFLVGSVKNGQTEQVKTGQVNPDRPLVGPCVDTFMGCFVGSP